MQPHPFSRLLFCLFLALPCFSSPVFAKPLPRVTVGVVYDGPSQALEKAVGMIAREVRLLTEGEFDVDLPREKRMSGDWHRAGIESALSALQADPEVDMVIALGFNAAVVTVNRDRLAKPTIAAILIHDTLAGAPRHGDASGRANLNYLTIQADLTDHIDAFARVARFEHLVILTDSLMLEVMPKLATNAGAVALTKKMTITALGHGSGGPDLISRLPPETDAVMLGPLPRMSRRDFSALLDGLADRGLPSYSLMGSDDVQAGALMTDLPAQDWQRRMRRVALNLQAILLGEQPEALPVLFEVKRRTVLNMATASRIGLSPPFDVLLAAELVGLEGEPEGRVWTLSEVAEQALKENLAVRASAFGVAAGENRLRETRAALLPQLDAAVSDTHRRDDTAGVTSGAVAERQAGASLALSQLLYSEATFAAVDMEDAQQTARVAESRQQTLNAVQEATVTFLSVLQAQTQFGIRRDQLESTRRNLELAHDRVEMGSAANSEVFRWENEMAQAQVNLLTAVDTMKRAQESLNRVLNRPLNERFSVMPAALSAASVLLGGTDLDQLLNNPAAVETVAEVLIRRGLAQSPEIAALEAQVNRQERALLSAQRGYWSPTVTLTGEVSEVLQDSRSGALSQDGDADWRAGVTLSLPLLEGGGRSARVSGARHTLEQLRLQLADTGRAVEQAIRARLRTAQVSHLSIGLNTKAAEAARNNFDLVSDAYGQGLAGVIDLIDAQNAKVTAELTAANAVFQFLIDLMNMQRATGAFDLFLDDAGRDALLAEIQAALAGD